MAAAPPSSPARVATFRLQPAASEASGRRQQGRDSINTSSTGETAVRRSASLRFGGERILVVEDDQQVRTSVVAQLLSLGYAVSQAPDGAAGVAAFHTATDPFDLLLTDVVMPGPLNGKGLADEVTRHWPQTRIVFMSGYAEDAIVHHGRLDPDVLLLAKPFRKRDLARIVRRALDGGSD